MTISCDIEPFLVLGNGGGGTSMLRGLLNAHALLDVLFEDKGGPVHTPADERLHWIALAAEVRARGIGWGNKIPVEQLLTRRWTDDDIVRLIDDFRIVFLRRRLSRYDHGPGMDYPAMWRRTGEIYWRLRARCPDRIIQVAFEVLLLRPESELTRICAFIGVDYDPAMPGGTAHTGYSKYDQSGFNLEKV